MTTLATAAVLAGFGLVSVTNHAGAVLTGELTSVTNGTFTVGGRTLSLSVLKPTEQMRVRRLAGCDMRSPAERRDAQKVALEFKTVDELLKAGRLTPAEADERRRRIRAAAEFRKTHPLNAGKKQ